ncbi:hypothetical protein KM043_018512 [Ampulex compressa]|nr:hypothetical protein KM043_018512 [Ampulex compressa]
MDKSGAKKRRKHRWGGKSDSQPVVPAELGIPISDLPSKLLFMRVKSSTKIRNMLRYALKEFPNYECIVWTAMGHGIGKAITCAELFKRKLDGLHQITKLHYVQSDKPRPNKETKMTVRSIPQIYTFLARDVKDEAQAGYQAPGDCGMFSGIQGESKSKIDATDPSGHAVTDNVTCINAEEFAAMGLRTGQKRSKKEQQTETPPKKNKRTATDDQ